MFKMNKHWVHDSVKDHEYRVRTHENERAEFLVSRWDTVSCQEYLIPVIYNMILSYINNWASDVTPISYLVVDGEEVNSHLADNKWAADLFTLEKKFKLLVELIENNDDMDVELYKEAMSLLTVMLPLMWH